MLTINTLASFRIMLLPWQWQSCWKTFQWNSSAKDFLQHKNIVYAVSLTPSLFLSARNCSFIALFVLNANKFMQTNNKYWKSSGFVITTNIIRFFYLARERPPKCVQHILMEYFEVCTRSNTHNANAMNTSVHWLYNFGLWKLKLQKLHIPISAKNIISRISCYSRRRRAFSRKIYVCKFCVCFTFSHVAKIHSSF